MTVIKHWIEVFLRNYLKFVMFSMPFLIAYIPFLTETLSLKSPFIIALYYCPILLSAIWIKDIIKFNTIKYYSVIILISLITLIWSLDLNKGITDIFLLGITLVSSYLIYLYDYRKIWAWFAWGMVIFTTLLKFRILYIFLNTYNFGGDRLGYLEGQFATDPNFLGMFIGLALFYFLSETKIYYSKGVNKLYVNIQLLASLLLLYFLFLTLSRTITLSLIFVFVLVFVCLAIKNYSKDIKLLFKTGLITVIAITFFIVILLNTPLSARFSGLLHDDRIEIWKIIWGLIGRFDIYSFFGYGLGSSDLMIGKYFYGAIAGRDGVLRFSAHNLYFDWLLQTGLIGFFILLFLVGKSLNLIWRSLDRRNLDIFLIGTFFLLCSIGINTFGHYSWPVIVGLFLSTLLTKESKQKGLTK